MQDITLTLNGCRHQLRVEPRRTLVDVIREECGATGTHIGCEHGVCGACTILMDGEPVRSCLLFAVQADGRDLRTVEGLEQNGVLHPLQRASTEHHALQCGYCTPGFLMLAVCLPERPPPGSAGGLGEGLSANNFPRTGSQKHLPAP